MSKVNQVAKKSYQKIEKKLDEFLSDVRQIGFREGQMQILQVLKEDKNFKKNTYAMDTVESLIKVVSRFIS